MYAHTHNLGLDKDFAGVSASHALYSKGLEDAIEAALQEVPLVDGLLRR